MSRFMLRVAEILEVDEHSIDEANAVITNRPRTTARSRGARATSAVRRSWSRRR